MIAGTDLTASAVLVDITPYTYGTSALGDLHGEMYPYMYVPIIHKNSSLPLSKTEVFYTVMDNQEAVEVRIFQGEESDALNNIQIGEFMVEGLNQAPQGNPILLKLELDLNGILHVSAKEKKTGLERTIVIDNAISRFEEDEMAAAKDRIKEIFGEGGEGAIVVNKKAETHHLVVQARALVEKVLLQKIEKISWMWLRLSMMQLLKKNLRHFRPQWSSCLIFFTIWSCDGTLSYM